MNLQKRDYGINVQNNAVRFTKNEEFFFSVPASTKINGSYSQMTLKSTDDKRIVFVSHTDEMVFELFDDFVIVNFSRHFENEGKIFESKIFASENFGINLKDFDRAFCPQPRNNQHVNLAYFHMLPNISESGYFCPPILEFCIGNKDAWVSFGLLDIPDTKICKMDDDYSFLVETCGGNKVIPAGGKYVMPRVIITFPKDEYDSITLFRQKLLDLGLYTPKKPKYSEIPAWWKNSFVCTYGDQILESRVGQKIDDAWVNDIVERAEKEFGMDKFNLIIDDSWQLPHAFEPIADEKRFPKFRQFIDALHKKGHHVILWQTPLFDNTSNGFITRAQRLGVLDPTELAPPVLGTYFEKYKGCYNVDYTADNARQYVKEICEAMFGNKEGQYNADGIKLDFMATLRDPATSSYAHPEKGLGMRELYLFYEMFYEEAKKVKPDVIIDCNVGDPRFEHLIDFNRLHDTHSGNIEKEFRARIATLGCPDLLIDSDGCYMFNSWLKTHYISCAIYGIPSNYYVKKYQDYHVNKYKEEKDKLPDEKIYLCEAEKRAIGNLFKMSRYRPNGHAFMESLGNWVLKDGDTVNAISQRGESVVYYPTELCDKGYIFTFQNEAIIIPLHGRKMSNITPAPKFVMVDYARGQAIIRITPGVIHTFENVDDGTGIENNFRFENEKNNAEEYVDYVNG